MSVMNQVFTSVFKFDLIDYCTKLSINYESNVCTVGFDILEEVN
jgi:hypothetical protein